MKKVLMFLLFFASTAYAFAGTCTVTGNGWSATARCSCTHEQACFYAKQAINAIR